MVTPETFRFEYASPEPPQRSELDARLASGRGAVICGAVGVGKTYLASLVVRERTSVWTEVPDRPYAFPQFLADVSAQVGAGDAALRTYAASGHEAALRRLEPFLERRCLVVDGAERLHAVDLDPVSPDVDALWGGELSTLKSWLQGRCNAHQTVVVTRERWSGVETCIQIKPPSSWVVKLIYSSEGFFDWKAMADRLNSRPGPMFVAAGALAFARPRRVANWLDTLDAEASPGSLVRGLASLVLDRAPRSVLRALAVVAACGELDRTLVRELRDVELESGIELARHHRLLDDSNGALRVLPTLERTGLLPNAERVGAEPILASIVRLLLSRVQDNSSLDPASARAVLHAHRLQLALGDFEGALTTARLHVGGLIGHARAMSVAAKSSPEYAAAARAYTEIDRLLGEHADREQKETRAYVKHYFGFNAHRAKSTSLERIVRAYDEASALWPRNALFHARRIALAAERGDITRALALLAEADAVVPLHERKHATLRVLPARWSQDLGAWEAALRLLEDYVLPEWLIDVFPEAYEAHSRLMRDWQEGFPVRRLVSAAGDSVVFRVPVHVQIRRTSEAWTASTDYPPASASGSGPWTAVQALGDVVAGECRRLVSTPTPRLTRQEVGKKGLFLGAIDLGSSRIGLPHHDHRWIVGRIENAAFVATSDPDLALLEVPVGIAPSSTEGFFVAKVRVDTVGAPLEITRIVPAGSGRTVDELFELLAKMYDEAESA